MVCGEEEKERGDEGFREMRVLYSLFTVVRLRNAEFRVFISFLFSFLFKNIPIETSLFVIFIAIKNTYK